MRITKGCTVSGTGTLVATSLGSGAATVFTGSLLNNGNVSGVAGHTYIFRNNLTNNGTFNINSFATFGLNDLTIADTNPLTFGGPIDVNNQRTVLQSVNVTINNTTLSGSGNNSRWVVGSDVTLFHSNLLEPMATGQLICTTPGSTVRYQGVNGQRIKSTSYQNLGFANAGAKVIQGDVHGVNVTNATANTVLSFSGITKSSLSVTGSLTLSNVDANMDMTGGGWDHVLYFSGNTLNWVGALLRGQGRVVYNGTTALNIPAKHYHHMVVDGAVAKTLVANTTVAGLTLSGSAILATNTFTLQASGGGTFSILDGSTFALGTSVSAVSGPFPTGFSVYSFGSQSTVQYAANAAQNIASTPTYGHLQLSTGATPVTKTAANTLNIRGKLSVGSNVTLDVHPAGVQLEGDELILNGNLNYSSNTTPFVWSCACVATVSGSTPARFMDLQVQSDGGLFLNNHIEVLSTLGINTSNKIFLSNRNLSITGNVNIPNADATTYIESSGLLSGGSVKAYRGAAQDFTGMLLPVGVTGYGYTPFRVTLLSGTGSGTIGIKPLVTVLGGTDKVDFAVILNPDGGGVGTLNEFRFTQDYPAALRTGNPTNVRRDANTLITNGFVDLPNNRFGIGSGGYANINGIYYASGTTYLAQNYRSKFNGSWSDVSIWEVTPDEGVSWFPATTVPGRGASGDRVSVSTDVTIDVPVSFPLSTLGVGSVGRLIFGTIPRTV